MIAPESALLPPPLYRTYSVTSSMNTTDVVLQNGASSVQQAEPEAQQNAKLLRLAEEKLARIKAIRLKQERDRKAYNHLISKVVRCFILLYRPNYLS